MTNAKQLRMETIGDIVAFLDKTRQSPEMIAKQVEISNMTIRRLLKRPAREAIPQKYRLQFGLLLHPESTPILGASRDFASMLNELRVEGDGMSDMPRLRSQLDEKLRAIRISSEFKRIVREVSKAAFAPGSARTRSLCIGALLYLINPMDLMPDYLGPMGLLDDFGVLSLVLTQLAKKKP